MDQLISNMQFPSPKRKHLPLIPSTWEPPVAGLGKVESICPELLEHVTDRNRDVDQSLAMLVEMQAQMSLLDRVGAEADMHGFLTDDIKKKKYADAQETIASLADARTLLNSSQEENWKCMMAQELQDAFNAALDLHEDAGSPTGSSMRCATPPSFAMKWHQDRREEMVRDIPEVASLTKNNTTFFLTPIIGVIATLLQVYTITMYIPRLWFRVMLGSNSHKAGFVMWFSFVRLLGRDSIIAKTLSDVELSLSFFSPFSLNANWMENSLPEFTPIRLFFLLLHVAVLAAVWGWWCVHTSHVMACEISAENTWSCLATFNKPSRNRFLQGIRKVLKDLFVAALHGTMITGRMYEYCLLGHRGHLEALGSGEISQLHLRTALGQYCCESPYEKGRVCRLDGGLSLPWNLLKKQRRWVAIISDKYGVPIRAFPESLVRAARCRHFISRNELLREEARLLENDGERLYQMHLLDSSGMQEYMRQEAEAIALANTSNNMMEAQYGGDKRAMTNIMLFHKEHYLRLRGVSTSDFNAVTARANFYAVDPRPLKAMVENDHPSVNTEDVYKPIDVSRVPTMFRWYPWLTHLILDSAIIAFSTIRHFGHSMALTIPVCIVSTVIGTLCLLQPLPVYSQTFGALMRCAGSLYQRDNYGMFLSVNGLLRGVRFFGNLAKQGARYLFVMFLTAALIVLQVNSSFDFFGDVTLEFGHSKWWFVLFVTLTAGFYEILSELFALGFLWHPIWFVKACGHLTPKAEDGALSGEDAQEVQQPSVSMYSFLWFWLTFGETHQVEQHDFPRLPWIYRRKLRGLAPAYYERLRSYSGLVDAAKVYRSNEQDMGVYAAVNAK